MVKIYTNKAHQKKSLTTGMSTTSKQLWPISLSIAFYNNRRFFDLMIAAVLNQSTHDFELIISDDGSRPDIVEHSQKTLEDLPIPAMHLWHDDKGFRKNRMLNWAIHHSHSEYIIFIDQDCLPHPEFVNEHNQNKQNKKVLSGRRMELVPWLSAKLTPEMIQNHFIENNLWWIIPAGSYKKDNNGPKGIYIKSQWLRRLINNKERGLVGCNFSAYKEDLLSVNGFDWRYEGAGTGEDSDIDYRLQLKGITPFSFANAAVQYHVFHPLTKKDKTGEAIFKKVQEEAKAFTDFGLQQQLEGK